MFKCVHSVLADCCSWFTQAFTESIVCPGIKSLLCFYGLFSSTSWWYTVLFRAFNTAGQKVPEVRICSKTRGRLVDNCWVCGRVSSCFCVSYSCSVLLYWLSSGGLSPYFSAHVRLRRVNIYFFFCGWWAQGVWLNSAGWIPESKLGENKDLRDPGIILGKSSTN